MNFAMATLGLKEMGKFSWEVGKKVCPVGCLSLVLLNWDSQQSRPFFFFLENAKNNLVFHFGVGRHASFPHKPAVKVHSTPSLIDNEKSYSKNPFYIMMANNSTYLACNFYQKYWVHLTWFKIQWNEINCQIAFLFLCVFIGSCINK